LINSKNQHQQFFQEGQVRNRKKIGAQSTSHVAPKSMDPFSRRRTQEAMVRLDPILQWLLNLVNQYQELMDERVTDGSSIVEGYSEDMNKFDQEKLLGVIRAQVQLLQRLQQTLENLVHDTSSTVGSSMATTKKASSSSSRGLSILSEYMYLPLNAILQITSQESALSLGSSESSSTASQSATDEHERFWKIRASSVLQLQQETARTITMFVEKCSIVSAPSDVEDTFEKQTQSQNDKCTPSPFPASKTTYVPNAHVVRFLISLATALPMGVRHAQAPGDSSPSSATSSGDGHTSTSSLDNGIDCYISILNAITALMSYAGPSNEGLAIDIAKALNGVLLARIADACSFFLLQVTAPAVMPSSSLSPNLRRLQPQSAHLALHALKTLDAMFQAIPDEKTLWQAMFPGIFATLHRFWMRLRRLVVSSGLASEMQCHGLRTMTRFLRLTLTTTTINATGKTGPKESTVLILAELQSLATQAKNPMVVEDATTDVTVSRVESTDEAKKSQKAEFLEQVNARVVAPLTALIQTIPSSPLVKVEAVSICRAILVDTRSCWKKSDIKELFNLTLECCLLLQQDHSGKCFYIWFPLNDSARRPLTPFYPMVNVTDDYNDRESFFLGVEISTRFATTRLFRFRFEQVDCSSDN
jgi:hypothetical protein